ncbi:MAG: hypothetical protein ACRDV8_02235 [Acidimicrobiales bacterium]
MPTVIVPPVPGTHGLVVVVELPVVEVVEGAVLAAAWVGAAEAATATPDPAATATTAARHAAWRASPGPVPGRVTGT